MVAEKPLDGKVALITGGSKGIGLAIARSLGRLGAKLSLCARHADKLETAAAELQNEGAKVMVTAADVTRASDIGKLVQKTEQSFGAEADWDAVLDTNLKSVFLLSKAVAPGMIERRAGHIINIASLAGKNAFAGGGIYCASKWGLLGLTECMAEDLRQYGIRVSAICPGSVATDFSPHAGKDARKMLQPEDIAHAVEAIVLQAPQSFISEILLRPTQKP